VEGRTEDATEARDHSREDSREAKVEDLNSPDRNFGFDGGA